MVAIYVRWVKAGRMTLDDVPARWRVQVLTELNKTT